MNFHDYPHQQEAIGQLNDMYDGTLPAMLAVQTFRNIHRLFPVRRVTASPQPKRLPTASYALPEIVFVSRQRQWTLEDYLHENRVTGLLVLQNGKIVKEHYGQGNTDQTRWMSMSVAKSITSTLAGVALKEGKIGSLDDQVIRYLPALQGTGYDGVSLRQVLTMSSGVRWNETYTDATSDRRAMLTRQLGQQAGSILQYMGTLPRQARPGSVTNYNTGETQILGAIVEAATGQHLADYLCEHIWQPYGMADDASWWLDSPEGAEIGGSGFSATLRDYGRFGLYCLENGCINGQETLPVGWMQEAGGPRVQMPGRGPYGYMWWGPRTPQSTAQQAYLGKGIFGQYLYINPTANLVIVVWSARAKPVESEVIDDGDFFEAVVKACPPHGD